MHADNLPVPEARGTRQVFSIYEHKSMFVSLSPNYTQFVLASVPWTNELFFYAIVAVDEKGNRGQIR